MYPGVYPQFSGENPTVWLETMEDLFEEYQVPMEKYVDVAIRCLRGAAWDWGFYNAGMVMKRDWCAFSYHILWEFDPTAKPPDSDENEIVEDNSVVAVKEVVIEEVVESVVIPPATVQMELSGMVSSEEDETTIDTEEYKLIKGPVQGLSSFEQAIELFPVSKQKQAHLTTIGSSVSFTSKDVSFSKRDKSSDEGSEGQGILHCSRQILDMARYMVEFEWDVWSKNIRVQYGKQHILVWDLQAYQRVLLFQCSIAAVQRIYVFDPGLCISIWGKVIENAVRTIMGVVQVLSSSSQEMDNVYT